MVDAEVNCSREPTNQMYQGVPQIIRFEALHTKGHNKDLEMKLINASSPLLMYLILFTSKTEVSF